MNIFIKENIIIFTLLVVFFSIIVLIYGDVIHEDVYAIIYTTPIIIIAIMSLSLSKKYRKIAHFCYGHMILGFAFIFQILAEFTWRLMGYNNLQQYESYPDIFYLCYGILLILHPWVIMRHFKVKPTKIAWLIFLLCVVTGIGIYNIISIDYLDSPSFLFGLGFVILTSVLLGSVIIAILTLRETKIFRIWILLGIAFFINATADIYYYASENFSDWQQNDLVNIVWFIGYIIIIYALIEHRHKYSIRREKRY